MGTALKKMRISFSQSAERKSGFVSQLSVRNFRLFFFRSDTNCVNDRNYYSFAYDCGYRDDNDEEHDSDEDDEDEV